MTLRNPVSSGGVPPALVKRRLNALTPCPALSALKSQSPAPAPHLSDQDLLRFLRAREFDVAAASAMLTAAVAFHAEHKPETITLADVSLAPDICPQSLCNKNMVQVRLIYDRGVAWSRGHDRLGRPAFWVNRWARVALCAALCLQFLLHCTPHAGQLTP